jgi:hypothetical protein
LILDSFWFFVTNYANPAPKNPQYYQIKNPPYQKSQPKERFYIVENWLDSEDNEFENCSISAWSLLFGKPLKFCDFSEFFCDFSFLARFVYLFKRENKNFLIEKRYAVSVPVSVSLRLCLRTLV